MNPHFDYWYVMFACMCDVDEAACGVIAQSAMECSAMRA